MKIAGIILAAGYSKRMQGHLKPLLKIKRKTFLESIIHKMKKCKINPIFVVVGYKKDMIINTHSHIKGVKWVYNENFSAGQFSSLKKGVIEANKMREIDAILMTPVDMPLVKLKTYRKLIKKANTTHLPIVKPFYNYKSGHPIIFNRNLFKKIIKSPNTAITRDFFKENFYICKVNDPFILKDFDFYKDYIKIFS